MAPIRRLVLDVLKPHDPSMIEFITPLSEIDGVESISGTLVEIEEDTRSLQLVVEGQDLEFEQINEAVRDLGASVHSVDQVVCGDQLPEFDSIITR